MINNSKVLVSIVMPCYNSEKFIGDSIESIINQTYSNWELLITDDNSSDYTINTIKKYLKNDDRIKIFRLKKNSGAGMARNKSILNAKGRFIAFCDSDDLWEPNKLETQTIFMLNNGYDFVYTNLYTSKKKSRRLPENLDFKELLKHNYIATSTVMLNRDIIKNISFTNSRKRQDYIFWLDVLKNSNQKAYLFNKSLTYYRLRKGSLSSNKLDLLKYHYSIYRREGFSKIKSFFFTINYIILLFLKK
jgi:teichuronic acid biosynthesis glycosyltransferase TuaG